MRANLVEALRENAVAVSFALMALAMTLTTAGAAGVNLFSQPVKIGTAGTAISASIRATTTYAPGTVAVDACTDSAGITVTGAATGAECVVGPPAAPVAGFTANCHVSATNTVVLRGCCHKTGGCVVASATWSVRVFNP